MKQGADVLSLLQILVRGDAANHAPLAPKRRFDCVRFYFTADGTHRLFAATHRSGNKWIELGLALAFDLARGGHGLPVAAFYRWPNFAVTQSGLRIEASRRCRRRTLLVIISPLLDVDEPTLPTDIPLCARRMSRGAKSSPVAC